MFANSVRVVTLVSVAFTSSWPVFRTVQVLVWLDFPIHKIILHHSIEYFNTMKYSCIYLDRNIGWIIVARETGPDYNAGDRWAIITNGSNQWQTNGGKPMGSNQWGQTRLIC